MNDPRDDELVSAVLDGDATDDELARVMDDPGSSRRVDELRAARDALTASADVAIDDRRRDEAIAAAVRSMPAALDDRRRARRRVQVASIAAALLLVIGVAGVIALAGRDSRSSSTTAAGPAASSSSATTFGQRAAQNDTAANDTAVPAAGSVVLVDLGSYPDRAALVLALQQQDRFALASAAPAVPSAAAEGTDKQAAAPVTCAVPPDIRLAGRAELQGEAVVVVVHGTPDALVVDVFDSACGLLFSQAL